MKGHWSPISLGLEQHIAAYLAYAGDDEEGARARLEGLVKIYAYSKAEGALKREVYEYVEGTMETYLAHVVGQEGEVPYREFGEAYALFELHGRLRASGREGAEEWVYDWRDRRTEEVMRFVDWARESGKGRPDPDGVDDDLRDLYVKSYSDAYQWASRRLEREDSGYGSSPSWAGEYAEERARADVELYKKGFEDGQRLRHEGGASAAVRHDGGEGGGDA